MRLRMRDCTAPPLHELGNYSRGLKWEKLISITLIIVGFRINETLQTGAVGNRTYWGHSSNGRRCFQLRRFNPPRHLCDAVRKTKLPFYPLVGAVSNCAYSVRLKTAPTGRRKCPFIFRIHHNSPIVRSPDQGYGGAF